MFGLRHPQTECQSDAYKAFYQRSILPLAAHLRRLGVNSQEDLEDIIQETYVQAFKSWTTLQDKKAEIAWLFTIGRRQWGQLLERKKRRNECAFDTLTETENKLKGIAPHAAVDVQLDARHFCDQVIDIIDRVADATRQQALRMYYLQEATLPEIHQALQVNTSTLTTWLSRFRAEMKQLMASRDAARTKTDNQKSAFKER